ncbi:MAG: hypothetical protein V4508_15410 [Pseudomonadota bacterium]
MSTTADILQDIFELEVHAPFQVEIGGVMHRLQYLVRGKGGGKALVVDAEQGRLAPIAQALEGLGYGVECFDLDTGDFEEFIEVLDEWEIPHA